MLGPNSTLSHNRPIEYNGYKMYRKDCQPGKWGVAIIVKEDIPHSEMNIRSALEQVTIHYQGKDISITSLYLPPSMGFDIIDLERLNRQLLNNKMILGDLNSHHTLWGDKRICPRGRRVLKFVSNNNLVILNKEDYTCISATGWTSSIDISIVSPQLTMDTEWYTYPDMLGSNHLPVCIAFANPDSNVITPTYIYNIEKANWSKYTCNTDLSLLNTSNAEDNCISIQN